MQHHTDEHPRRNEEEYFTLQSAELVKQLRANLDEQRRVQERKSHYMRCPKCGADLSEREHDHVKIDFCPECHGLWLDAGELRMIRHMSRSMESRVMHDIIEVFCRAR
jgi:uncharacterized protein with PIN domain